MDDSMLTEDIDSALRALGKNVNVVHEINALSYELALTTYQVLWKQRLRWAQGWSQASIKHVKLAWNKPEEGNRKACVRAGIVPLLFVRELSYYLVTQYTCLVINFIVVDFPKSPTQFARLVFFQFPVSEWFFIIRSCLESDTSPGFLLTILQLNHAFHHTGNHISCTLRIRHHPNDDKIYNNLPVLSCGWSSSRRI
jgi:cellulose synthase/poly-beta-1,6-N-acetylglucosamine synthase-like glycosyltransferase